MDGVRVLAFLLVSAPLLAQGVSLGLRTGIVVTPFVRNEAGQRNVKSPFTVGPSLEVRLWRDAALGLDLLFYHPGFEVAPSHLHVTMWRAQAAAAFIYRFRAKANPLVRTGIAFNRVFAVGGAKACARGPFGEQFYCVDDRPVAELRHRGTMGFVAAGGVGWKFGKLRVEPEIRVMHWFDRNFGVRDSAVRSNLNEAALLFGITF